MTGFGTVVTGTLADGELQVEDEIEILPAGLSGRVRGLQTHKKTEAIAVPGSRTAVNISGVSTDQIRRGDVVAHRGQYQPTRRLDARFRPVRDSATTLKHASEVKLFVGASETMARLRLLDADEIQGGEEAWIQLELRDPIVAVRGDRYVLRRPSPGETLGGGAIVDHQPKGRHKRFDPQVLQTLAALAKGTPADLLLEAALALHAAPVQELVDRSRLDAIDAAAALKKLLEQGRLIPIEEAAGPDMLVMANSHWIALRARALQLTDAFHRTSPLRRGMPREELKSKLKLQARVFNAVLERLVREQALTVSGNAVALPGHTVEFDPAQHTRVHALMAKFAENPFSPPSVKDSQAQVGEALFEALLDLDELVEVSADVVFRKKDHDAMVSKISEALQRNGRITLAEVRDLFDTSRKYAQAVLEHLDAIGVTVRTGDIRTLKK
jgi:selenocysteine-specific elongation factor